MNTTASAVIINTDMNMATVFLPMVELQEKCHLSVD